MAAGWGPLDDDLATLSVRVAAEKKLKLVSNGLLLAGTNSSKTF